MLLENNPYSQDSRVRNEARSLHSAGHRVTVIAPRADGEPFRRDADGVTVYGFREAASRGGALGYAWEFGYSTLIMGLLSLLAWVREGFDVVHAHNPPETLFLIGGFYKLLFGKRFVFDHHDLSPEMYDARYGAAARPQIRRVLEWLERSTFRTADHVITTNESHRAVAVERGGMGPSDVTIVRNGPRREAMRPGGDPDPELRARAHTIVGYVGIMGPQDGVDHLIRAVAHLVHDLERTDVLCVIIGRGDALPDLERLASDLEVADKVWFAGWVGSEDLVSLLAATDICADPDPSNPYNDKSTMIKLMEYMAMAKPIVAFDLPEHRVSAGDAALYAEPNDEMDFARKIAELMDDPQQRAAMGDRGRARFESTLAWEHQEVELLRAYSQLAASD